MLYLLAVLTFLAGILFYGLSPRDDSIQLNTRQAEGMIIAFVNQHQAAKDYLHTWLGASATNGNLVSGTGNLKAGSNADNPIVDFERYLPKDLVHSMCSDNQGVPGTDSCSDGDAGFVTRVVCVNNAGTEIGCDDAAVKKRYVYTFGGWGTGFKAPSWWPNESHPLRRYEGWRRAIANRTRGSANCGTLWSKAGGTYCVDNGSQCKGTVPQAIINALIGSYSGFSRNKGQAGVYLNDLLFCYSEYKHGIGEYASGPDIFYDGISNAGVGKYSTATTNWQNLASGTNVTSVNRTNGLVTVGAGNYYTFTELGELNFSDPDKYFTINVVARSAQTNGSSAQGLDLIALKNGGNYYPILRKTPSSYSQAADETHLVEINNGRLTNGRESLDGFCLLFDGGVGASLCSSASDYQLTDNPNVYKSEGTISWTLVKRGNEISVYDNARKLFTREISPPGCTTNCFNFDNGIGQLSVGGLQGGTIYGVRYWPYVLSDKEIEKNVSVDFHRFGLIDPDLKYDDRTGLYIYKTFCPANQFQGSNGTCYPCNHAEPVYASSYECFRCNDREWRENVCYYNSP